MKINKEWHLKNKMPENPTLEERIKWHISHSENCSCREMPESIIREIAKQKGVIKMKYWLMKSEPDVFSIDDLKKNKKTHWDGVRNFQARNFMKNEMKKGDKVIFYHSNADPSGAAGIAEVIKEGYPDHTQFDPDNKHFEPKADPQKPYWYMVDVKFVGKFKKFVPLGEIKKNPKLRKMRLVQRGNRLSVMPVEKSEFDEIVRMGNK